MSAESELLIKIRTALEAGGLDAAKSKLTELTGVTAKGAAVTAESTAASSKHTAEMIKAGKTLSVVKAAAEGNIGAVIKLTAETNAVTGSLAKAIPVLGSFWAGWEAGKKIGGIIWNKVFALDKFDAVTGSIKSQTNAAIENLKALDKVKLSELLGQLEKIVSEISILTEKTGMIQDRKTAVQTAQQEVEVSDLEKRYAGQDKGTGAYEKERAALEKKHSEERLLLKSDNLDEMDRIANEKENKLRSNLDKVKEEEATALAAASETSRIRSMGRSGPQGLEDLKADRVAQEEAKMATKRRADLEKEAAPEFRQLEATRFRNETERQTLRIGVDATRNKYTGSLSEASTQEQNTARKVQKEAATQENEKAERDGRIAKEEALRKYEAEKTALEANLADAGVETSMRKQVAGKYAPDKNATGSKLKQQQAKDGELDALVIASAAREAGLKKALQALALENKNLVKSIESYVEGVKENNKNLPL